MSQLKIAKFTIELKTPGMFTKRIGKGYFYESLYGIPGSTVLGALSQHAIESNVQQKLGNCSKISSPQDSLDCASCPESDKCRYLDFWERQKLRISDALPIDGTELSTSVSTFIPNLLSIHKAKEEDIFADSLLLSSAQYLAFAEGKNRRLMLQRPILQSTSGDGKKLLTKKKKQSVLLDESKEKSEIKKWEFKSYSATHLGTSNEFLNAKKGFLFSYDAHPAGTRFSFKAIGESQLLDTLQRKIIIRVGAGRSRGYGLASMYRESLLSHDEYIETRSSEIHKGFKENRHILEKWGIDLTLGTITGITPLQLVNSGDLLNPKEAISLRTGIAEDDLILAICKRMVRPRWDRSQFILTPCLFPGYVASFRIDDENLENQSEDLAEIEFEDVSSLPGYGWIDFNHPIHRSRIMDFEMG